MNNTRDKRRKIRELVQDLESLLRQAKDQSVSLKEFVANLGWVRDSKIVPRVYERGWFLTHRGNTELAAIRDKIRTEDAVRQDYFSMAQFELDLMLEAARERGQVLQARYEAQKAEDEEAPRTLSEQLAKLNKHQSQATSYEEYLSILSQNGFISTRQEARVAELKSQDAVFLAEDCMYDVLRTEVIWARPFLQSHEARFMDENGIEVDWSLPGYLIVKNQPVLGINLHLLNSKYPKWEKDKVFRLITDMVAQINVEPHLNQGCIFRCMGDPVCVGNFVYIPLLPYQIHESLLKKWAFSAGWAVGGAKKALGDPAQC